MATIRVTVREQAALGAYLRDDGRIDLPFDNMQVSMSVAEARRIWDYLTDVLEKVDSGKKK